MQLLCRQWLAMERDTPESCVLSHTLSTDYDANLIKATDNVLKAKDQREK